MRLKVLSVLAALVLVAACETDPTTSGSGGGAGGSTTASSGAGTTAGTAGSTGGSAGTRSPLSEQFARAGERVFFDYDKFNLKPEARTRINEWANLLKANAQATVLIEGNCDERGTREYNLALGERRANAVRDYLIGLGIAANRITTISYGKERPVAVGSNEAAWSQNRNGRIVAN